VDRFIVGEVGACRYAGESVADKQYDYRDPAGTMAVLRIFIFIQLAVLAIMLVALVLQYALLQDIRAGAFASRAEMIATAEAADFRLQVLSVVGILTIAAAVITFLVWVYRTSANAHALGAGGLSAGAGLAVGSYFIPLANFVMPAINMSEVERASRDAANWAQLSTWWGVPLWWTTWVIMNLTGLFIGLATRGTSADLGSLETVIVAQGGYKVVEILAYVLLLAVATRVTRLQRAQHDRLAAPASA
jgi:Domain of unknown function (DUF4328)